MSRTAVAYRDQLVQLLPPGRAWSGAPGSVLGGLIEGLADEFARVDGRADDLVDEADPRTALELLPDWERVAGLPDACVGVPDTIGERRVAVANKIAQLGGQSIPFFTAICNRLGYDVEIGEFTSCDAGFGAGAELCGDDWRHAWLVTVFLGSAAALDAGYAEFSAGSDAGDRLVGFGALDLECLIRRARPAHTEVIFAYYQEPSPALWIDFLQG